MKKLISILLTIGVCCGLLAGCGSEGKPAGMNEDIYSYGVNAVEIVDSFLQSDLTAEEAEKKIETLYDSADSVETDEIIDDSVKSSLSLLMAEFRNISYQELSEDVDLEDMTELRKVRDNLKERLNMK